MKTINYNRHLLAVFVLLMAVTLQLAAADNSNGILKVKGDQYYPPYEFINAKGEPDGFNVELFKTIAADLNLNYTLELGPWTTVRKELENNQIDLLLGVLVSDTRSEKMTFGLPFSMMTYDIFTRHGKSYENLEALKGKKVVVQRGDLMHDYLIEQGLTNQLILANDQFEALQFIQQGLYDAAIIGSFQAAHLIQQHKLFEIEAQSANIKAVPYAMAVPKSSDTLIWMLNAALYNLKEDGTYDQLYNKWFNVYERKDFFSRNLGWIMSITAFMLVLVVVLIFLRNRLIVIGKRLRFSSEQYRVLIQNQQDFILKLSPRGTIMFASPSFCALVEKSEKELHYKAIDQLLGKTIADVFLEKIDELKKGSVNVEAEMQMELSSVPYWVNWRFTGLNYGKSQMQEVLVVGRDVSLNKQYDEALRSSENRFRQLLETIPNISVQGYAEDGKVLYWNKASEVLYGYTKEEAIGRTLYELIIPDEAIEFVRKDVKKMIDQGFGIPASELELKRKDGSLVNVFSSHAVIPKTDGKRELYCVDVNLTEIKQAQLIQKVLFNITNAVHINSNIEDLIRIIHRELSQLMDCSNLYIAFYDAEKDEFSTYEEYDDIESIPVWPAEGSLTGLVVKQRRSLLIKDKEFNEMVRKGEVALVGIPSAVWLGVPLIAEGEVIGAVVVQSFENEEAYDQRTVDLMEFVSTQISLAIQKQQNLLNLLEAKQKAEQSDKLKSAFLNNLSHEIRTPLNAIVGLSAMFDAEETLAEERKLFGELIADNSRQLTSIIDDIVHMSAIETDQVELYPSEFAIFQMMDELSGLFMIRNQNPDVNVILEFPQDKTETTIHFDESKLRKIVYVLMDNALKFTEKGEVKLSWNIEKSALWIQVEDTGIGIAPQDQEKIFERFQKVEGHANKLFRGNGLGLSIARAYTQLLGGHISLDSEIGKGTKFSIRFPVKITSTPQIKKTMNEFSDSSRKIKVLIVEDEYSNLRFIKSSLKEDKYELTAAGNGSEAVKLFEQNPDFDLVLMDLKLPVLSGFDATRQIKAIRPNVPIVAITAYALRGDKEKALEAGCDAYLSKPFMKEELLLLMDRFVSPSNR